MRSTKLRWKVLAGMLCAAMVIQSVPAEAVASETAETVQSYDTEGESTAEEELQTGSASPESESAESDTSEHMEGVSEASDVPELPDTSEMPDETETLDASETSDVPETPDAAESGELTDTTESVTEEDTTGTSETESDSTEEEPAEDIEETGQDITLLADERPDYNKLLSVVSEEKYFYYDDIKEIFVKLEDCEIQEDITITFSVDDGKPIEKAETEGEQGKWRQVGEYYVIPLQDVSAGSHKLTVRLTDDTDGDKELVNRTFNFATEEARVFTEADTFYISSTDETVEVTFFSPYDNIGSVRITAANGDIVARSSVRSASVPQKEDPRYTGIGDGYEYPDTILYKTTWVMPIEKNALEIGKYDIRLTLLDTGSEMLLSNAVEVSEKAVVTKCVLGMDYDNTNNFVYLYIQGSGFNPTQIRFDFEDEATSAVLSTTRIDYKTVQSGYIVKFRKEGNWDKAGKEIKVTISTRTGAGNINFTQNEFEAQLESGIYYAEYNNVLNAVEVGVTTDLNGTAVKFSIVDANDNLISDVTSRSLTESLAYLTPTQSLTPGTYYVKLEVGGNSYAKKAFYINQGTSVNHWEASKVISKNAERHDFYYYDTQAGISNDGLQASIDGYSGDVAVYASEWLREDASKGTRIQIWIPTMKLPLGNHTVRIRNDGGEISSYAFTIVASDNNKFILDTYSLSWIDDDTIQVYMKTPNCAETDDYEIKLTGVNDREPAEVVAEVTDRYPDSVFLNVTGLNKNNAFKDYYVLITHKKYGVPYKMSDVDEAYYQGEDEGRGEKTSIFSSKGLPVISNNRIIGINIQNMALPATLTVYATDSTDVITRLTIPSTTEGNYYYFTKDFYDSLTVKDRLYDMTLSDFGANWGRSYARVNIGYKDETIVNDIDVQITSDMLYVDGAESGRSAVITVSGNSQKPVFEISDEEIVELEDYLTEEGSPDPNRKRVIAKETGTTVITVIADGVTKSVSITVTRSATGITLNTTDRNMKVGDFFEAEAFIQPKSAQDPTQIVNFSSSDNNILYVRQLTNTTARVTALRAGTAVLRATLAGTTYTVAVNISITATLPLYDKKEIKIKEVGTVYYIENVDRSLSYCELPDGWKWDDGELSLTAGDGLQYCWATYTEEGYQPFSARLPVAVTRIVGINVTGRTLINRGQKEDYQITYEYVGANINTDKVRKRLELKCNRTSDEKIAELDTLDWDHLVIAAQSGTEGGTASFALTLTIDNGTDEGTDMFTKEFKVIVPAIDCVNSIKVKPLKASGQNFEYKESSDLMEVDVNEVKAVNNKYSVELKAETAINGVLKENIKLKWQTSDSAIAAVAVNQDGDVILTIKQAGYVEVTAVADDAGQCSGTLAVNIVDYSPVFETPTVTVNKFSSSGAELILQEQNGNGISSVKVLEGDGESKSFSVSNPVDGISRLTIKAGAPALGYTRKTVLNGKLEVQTSKGKYSYDMKITVDVTKPTATVKVKTKANLFYTNAEAVYTVSSKYDIFSIEDVTGEEPGAERVRFYGTYDKDSNTVRFDTNGTLDSGTLGQFTSANSPSRNLKLRITFAGYSEPQIVPVKVATENKKPSLSMTGMTACPGVSSGTVNVIESRTKAIVPVNIATMTFGITKPVNSGIVTEVNRNGSVSMTYPGIKSVSYTAELTSSEWTQAANAKGKITYVKSPDKMALALGSKQLILNMGTNITNNGVYTIPVSVNGSDIAISSMDCDGTARTLIDAGYLAYSFNPRNKTISLGLNEGKRGSIKAGSYKLNLYATVSLQDTEVLIKKATLTVKLTEAQTAKVVLSSPKGKINLVDRANTSVVYTPKVSGISSAITDVNVTGDGANYFTASLNSDNKVEIKAKTGKSMSSGESYEVAVVSTLQNGYQITTVVKIKPVNTLPKIVLTPAKCNLYIANSNKYTVSMSLKNSAIDLNNIIGIKIDTSTNKNANNFLLINNISKNGTVSFNLAGDRSRIKKGKYTVKCLVTFRDAAINSKPATVNMVITVK